MSAGSGFIKKHFQIFVSGVMVVVPFAVLAYVVVWVGGGLDGLVKDVVRAVTPESWTPGIERHWPPGVGAVGVLAGVYLVGILTQWWVFRYIVGLVEAGLVRVPVVKGIYEAVRDVMKLMGGEGAAKMGRVVRLRVPGTDAEMLGILTSANPRGLPGSGKVAVYIPLSYQLGGHLVYVPAESVQPVDMPVEVALRLVATAEAGADAVPSAPRPTKAEAIVAANAATKAPVSPPPGDPRDPCDRPPSA